MKHRHLRAVIIAVLVVSVLTMAASILFAAPNQNREVSRAEALEALAVLNAYFNNVPTPQPQAAARPTAVPTPTPLPTLTPTPVSFWAPTITHVYIGPTSIWVSWTAQDRRGVTGYEMRYRREGGNWKTGYSGGTSRVNGAGKADTFSVGARYEVQVRAFKRDEPSPWASRIVVVAAATPTRIPTLTPTPYPTRVPTFTPTPTPIVARERRCSAEDFAPVTIRNPESPTQLWHEKAVSWRLWYAFWFDYFEDGVNYADGEYMALLVFNTGIWQLNIYKKEGQQNSWKAVYTVDEGRVSIDNAWDAENTFDFSVNDFEIYDSKRLRVEFSVNGARIPITVSNIDENMIGAHFVGSRDPDPDWMGYKGNGTTFDMKCSEWNN